VAPGGFWYMTRLFGAVLALIVLCSANAASAACTSPAGTEGKYIYNSTHKTFQYCNDTQWVEMNIKAGSGSGGCTNPTAGEGEMIYNKDHQVLQGCAGNVWRVIGPGPNASGSANSAGWITVTTGADHTCGIKPDNTLWCWGGIDWGKIGLNYTNSPQAYPIEFEPGSTWKTISAGYVHTCGIKTDNTLWCWGQNLDGQLGIGSTTPFVSYTALQVSGGGSWKSVSSGYFHTCAIKSDDTAWCWGRNNTGMVGDNSTTQRDSPTAVSGGGTWKMISAGTAQSCGIKSDNTGWCWGYNNVGQVGDGTNTQRNVPTALSGGGTWKVIDAGDMHNCGIKSDDSAYCWGSNLTGQLGDNTTVAKNVPTAVNGGGSWKTISASTWFNIYNGHSCGIKTDDTAWCWGENGSGVASGGQGRLGDGTVLQRNIPTAVIAGNAPWTSISAGGRHTCGIRANGAIICWGQSNLLGANMLSFLNKPTEISGGGSWKKSAPGQTHGCGIKTDDTGWCWGSNSGGQVGNNAQYIPQLTPTSINGGGTWKQISGGAVHTCGIKSDDTARCWGNNGQGQLGDNTTVPRSTPVTLSGGGTWKRLSAGAYHTCGIRSDDTLRCWGSNGNGQIGDNSTTQRSSPTAVSGGGTWKEVAARSTHTCAIKMDDTIWCWGQNTNGQIGNGTSGGNILVPTAVSGGHTWKFIAQGSGASHNCAIRMDDTAWCWGSDSSGMIGDSTVGGIRTSPVGVDGGHTWKHITIGSGHSCGLKSDDTIWCWGSNVYGRLGISSNASYTQQTPIIISAAGTWNSVEIGSFHTCAIKSDNTMWCWGQNNDGQLTGLDESSPFSTSGLSPLCVNPTRKAGSIAYNSTHNVLQLCNGVGWIALSASYVVPDPCAGSPAVGTVCLDGSKYAGMSGADKMFVTLADDAAGTPWNNANFSNTVATGATSTSNGETNSQTIAATDADSLTGGIQPHQAVMVCENLNVHGQTDWYLPSIDELTTLYTNRVAIGGFTNTWFWSSTEMDADTARIFRFNTGAPLTGTKGNIYYVRCVRK